MSTPLLRRQYRPNLLFRPRQTRYVLAMDTLSSVPATSTTAATRRSWLTCWLTSCLVRARGLIGSTGRCTSPSPTVIAALHSFTPEAGRLLYVTHPLATTPTHITSEPTLPPGYALSEAERLLAQLQAGRRAGGED
jgi:hypothetical protein